ncbi:hypothetical protein [Lentibacillus sp. Marseille-P4043]|uniref:hypothetical protein n=1 Tax=Lentibacillus sp. Marseille-P4043 TaxID=2040293 RepID=UPI000D0B4933|nr:hypothetical protein [Lentibacillus sp. Marseille-P4043]
MEFALHDFLPLEQKAILSCGKMRDSNGKRNSLKTPQRVFFASEEAEAFPMESEYFSAAPV